tara:strand:- start:992 stop:1957 length:966 start_codon:yes stop_codon:yes gene_type:complete
MENILSVEEIKDDIKWDKFIFDSINKNIFSLSSFINNQGIEKKNFFIKKNDEVVASFHLFLNNKKIKKSNLIYTSINYKKYQNINQSSINYKKYQINQIYTDYIYKNYDSGEFNLDLHTSDLRTFFWKNFDLKKEVFSVYQVRYTSIIKLDNDLSINPNLDTTTNYSNFSRSIKSQYQKAMKEDFLIREEFNEKVLVKIISKTLANINDSNFDIEKNLIIYKELFKNGFIKMFICSKNGEDLAFCLFSVIKERSFYLNGGRLLSGNEDLSLTYNLIKSFQMLSKLGVKILDLEGVNSPRRSFWKSGFGGNLLPYYGIKFIK